MPLARLVMFMSLTIHVVVLLLILNGNLTYDANPDETHRKAVRTFCRKNPKLAARLVQTQPGGAVIDLGVDMRVPLKALLLGSPLPILTSTTRSASSRFRNRRRRSLTPF